MKHGVLVVLIFGFFSHEAMAQKNNKKPLTKDPIVEKLRSSFFSDPSDPNVYVDFKKSLETANIFYFGEEHQEKHTEIFRTSIVPILLDLKFDTFYVEGLPYFNSTIFSEFYTNLYSTNKKIASSAQNALTQFSSDTDYRPGKNKQYPILIQDLMRKKIHLFGYGHDLLGKTESEFEAISLLTTHSVEAVEQELKKPKKILKMVLYGGAQHNDSNVDESVIEEFVAGKKIKEIAKNKKYVSVDIISMSFLKNISMSFLKNRALYFEESAVDENGEIPTLPEDSKKEIELPTKEEILESLKKLQEEISEEDIKTLLDEENKRPDELRQQIIKLRYLSSIKKIEKKISAQKKPTLIRIKATDLVKNFCDYLIIVP